MDEGAQRLAELLRVQGVWCAELGSPLYASLLAQAAQDVLAGGVVRTVLAGHEDDPGPSALGLRLLGTVHRLVLAGRAPQLAPYYPSVGGTPEADAAWRALVTVLREHSREVRAGLASPPQTNEVGRAAALLGGLLHIRAAGPAGREPLPVRLVEMGASAGLNLHADSFRVTFGSPCSPRVARSLGPADSPVVLADAWHGVLPPLDLGLHVVEREGTDVAPVDPTTDEGATRLSSYVWPDQLDRLARLRGAIELARRSPVRVRRAGAAETLAGLGLRPGAWTVVWHSVMEQYLSADERGAVAARLEELGAQASYDASLAHLALEPRRRAPDRAHEFLVVVRTWPAWPGARHAWSSRLPDSSGEEERILGVAAGHGLPVCWE